MAPVPPCATDNGVVSLLLRERGGSWASGDLTPDTVEAIRSLVETDVHLVNEGRLPFTDGEFDLVVVNLAPHRSQCYATLSLERLAAHNWAMKDLLGQERYKRSGDDLQNQGLYLDLPAHGAQLFHFEPIN